ncbi:STN domain-containing protein [Pelagicoccus mobilis]|uniref:STN domain-containing protein n=1 Tax=Pelagicoccus mobilis TaxID=415221 RepID=A0A934RVL4_9BACT|nr:STN domain-containing protein [Pelagicoccus mobilis]MBK1875626.1 STN domain-containing protein [Pelagicoccus mobilis]
MLLATRRLLIQSLSLIALAVASVPFAWADASIDFDIQPGKASKTLKEFARQAELSIVFDSRSVREVETNSVSGALSAKQALALLLEGTTLVFEQDEETNAFAVLRNQVAIDEPKAPAPRKQKPPPKKLPLKIRRNS